MPVTDFSQDKLQNLTKIESKPENLHHGADETARVENLDKKPTTIVVEDKPNRVKIVHANANSVKEALINVMTKIKQVLCPHSPVIQHFCTPERPVALLKDELRQHQQ